MCAHGLTTWTNAGEEGAAKKATSLFTNSVTMAGMLDHECPGDHDHVHLMSGRAKYAAIYPKLFLDRILKGVGE